MTTNELRELNSRYDMRKIPAWLIRKNCRAYMSEAACILAIDDDTACFVRETEKALLFEWRNMSLISCHVSGGSFWVAKSLLR